MADITSKPDTYHSLMEILTISLTQYINKTFKLLSPWNMNYWVYEFTFFRKKIMYNSMNSDLYHLHISPHLFVFSSSSFSVLSYSYSRPTMDVAVSCLILFYFTYFECCENYIFPYLIEFRFIFYDDIGYLLFVKVFSSPLHYFSRVFYMAFIHGRCTNSTSLLRHSKYGVLYFSASVFYFYFWSNFKTQVFVCIILESNHSCLL